jgi:hypothetical protein
VENLELDKFLDVYNQPKWNQENINHLNRAITSHETETIERVKKNPGSEGFIAKLYHTAKEDLIP